MKCKVDLLLFFFFFLGGKFHNFFDFTKLKKKKKLGWNFFVMKFTFAFSIISFASKVLFYFIFATSKFNYPITQKK
jgi:hypothetical protein